MIVALRSETMMLADASDADLLAGANMAAAGSEIVQFGKAEPLGGGRWRLSTLVRGRFGSEDAAEPAAGAAFTLIDDADLFAIPAAAGLAPTAVGGVVTIEGAGDAAPVELAITQIGRAMRPLSPVQLTVRWQDDGGVRIGWVRRSRSGFGWIDGVDAPLDVHSERYRVDWIAGSLEGGEEAVACEIFIPSADVGVLRAAGPVLTIHVRQIGEAGASPALSGTFILV